MPSYSTLTIPYWDWTTTRSSSDPRYPFVDDFMGDVGETDTLIVRTGPLSTNLDGTSDWVLHTVDAEPESELSTSSSWTVTTCFFAYQKPCS